MMSLTGADLITERFNSDGTVDSSFASPEVLSLSPQAAGIGIQANGRIGTGSNRNKAGIAGATSSPQQARQCAVSRTVKKLSRGLEAVKTGRGVCWLAEISADGETSEQARSDRWR